MADPIIVVPYDPAWPGRFAELATPIRKALGETAVRIDHIGSTAVPHLAAKPIIDIQISVVDFDPLAAYRDPLQTLGYLFRANNSDLTKRYFREAPNTPRTHIHVRRHGSWSEQFALLFRDYLRTHPATAAQYAATKQQLAQQYTHDRVGYTNAKTPIIWRIIQQASQWSQNSGWHPGRSDA